VALSLAFRSSLWLLPVAERQTIGALAELLDHLQLRIARAGDESGRSLQAEGLRHAEWCRRLLTAPESAAEQRWSAAIVAAGIPPAYLTEIMEGAALELARRGHRDWRQWEQWSYKRRGVPLLGLARALGVKDPRDLAAVTKLSQGLHLREILRNMQADLNAGYVHFPIATLGEYGVTTEMLQARKNTVETTALAVAMWDRATALIVKADAGLEGKISPSAARWVRGWRAAGARRIGLGDLFTKEPSGSPFASFLAFVNAAMNR